MKDKTILIKSGVDVNSSEFKIYYEGLKQRNRSFYYLSTCVKNNWEGLATPCVFKCSDLAGYSIDDISFIWYEGRIIGHQFIRFEKQRLGERMSRYSNLRIEYYCEDNNLLFGCEEYYESRKNGKLESEVVISYEKQITIKKS